MTAQDGPLRVVSADELVGGAPASAPPPAPRQSVTVALTYPIQAHGEQVSTLTIRPPKTKELLAANALRPGGETLNTDAMVKLIVACCDIPLSSALALDPVDFFALTEAFAPFFKRPEPAS
jgi:hypothetical protein